MMNMAFFAATSEFILWEAFSAFDNAVYDLISFHIADGMTRFMKFISFCGSEWTIATLAAAFPAVALIFKKRKLYRWSLAVIVNIASGALLNQILKHLFVRARPDLLQLVEISGYSFPSGHSMNSLIFYGFFIYIILKGIKHRGKYAIAGAVGLLVFLIGISRIYLGVHYASDVLAGFLIGLGWLILFIRLADRYVLSNEQVEK